MIESGSQPTWVTVAAAARHLGITETAVRKRIRAGTVPARGDRGATEVLIQVENQERPIGEPDTRQSVAATGHDVTRLASDLSELRARLADAQHDRDRWHAAALEARADARAAHAAREAAERELRMVLARS